LTLETPLCYRAAMNPVLLSALAVLGIAAGAALGWWLNNRLGRRSLEAVRRRAEETARSSRREAEKEKRQLLLEAREEIFQQRNKVERDLRSRQGQVLKRERDLKAARQALADLEADLHRQRESMRDAEKAVADRESTLVAAKEEIERLAHEENVRLERVAGMTRDEARRQLLQNLKTEARFEAAGMIKEIKDEAQKTADAEAVKIISLAIERAASDLSAERTVTLFHLPEGSQLKGRIIGHEGKNIRAFEKATGIQLLIDEQENTVTLSGFNPVQRETARRVLATLVKDGNIHPRRIEDLVRRTRRRLDDEMRRAGEQAVK